MNMAPPRSIQEVQCLAGRMAALGSFVSYSAKKGLHFFKTLRSIAYFKWTDEAHATFDALKAYLASFEDFNLVAGRGLWSPQDLINE